MTAKLRKCHILTNVRAIEKDAQNRPVAKFELVEDKEFEWLFHGWGKDFEEFENGAVEFSVAIVEAECGKIAMVRADRIRFLA